MYFEDFETGGVSRWQVDQSDDEREISIETSSEVGNHFISSTGPWWFDPNHIDPGRGYVHLSFYTYLNRIFDSTTLADANLTNAEIRFKIRSDDLQLADGATLNFWFQAYDPNQGRYVNYVLSSVPIETYLVDGEWTEVAFRLSDRDEDWTALGSSYIRTPTYSTSTNIAEALSGRIVDIGVFVVVGNDISGAPSSGTLSLDDVSISLASDTSRTYRESVVNSQVVDLNLATNAGALGVESFAGASIEAVLGDGASSEESLSLIATGSAETGIYVSGGDVYVDGVLVGALSSAAGSVRIDLNEAASAAAVDRLVNNFGYRNLSDSPVESRSVEVRFTQGDLSEVVSRADIAVVEEPESMGNDNYLFSGEVLGLHPIFDEGGYDVIDASRATSDLAILLKDVPYSAMPGAIYTVRNSEVEAVYGGFGNDFLWGSDRPDVIHGGPGNDDIYGDAGDDKLFGGAGDDNLQGGAGADYLDGGEGFDYAYYSLSPIGVTVDLVQQSNNAGGATGDLLLSIEGLIGSAFDDTLRGDGQNNVLLGGAGNDVLEGRGGNDVLYGQAGDDHLWGGAGADYLDGGDGDDTAHYDDAASGVRADLSGVFSGIGDAAGDRFVSIENLVGSAFDDVLSGDAGANRIYGGDGADNLYGRDGDDALYGGAGDDNLQGGAGADLLDGGDGNDTAYYDDAPTGVRADLSGVYSGTGDAAGDRFVSVENLVGSAFNDVLFGDAGANRLYGGAGADNLYGGAGDDALYGGAGDDNLQGGAGADLLDGGDGFDFAYYSLAAAGVTVDLVDQSNNAGEAAGDQLVSIEGLVGSAFDDTLRGDARANILIGGAGNDILEGREGNDTLYGGAGDDHLWGGAGADVLDGGDGRDTAHYDDAASGVRADLSGILSGTGDAAGDRFISIENLVGSAFDDTLFGDAQDNILSGGAGNDVLEGRQGNDTLYGGAGDDHLWGGAGADLLDGGDGDDTAHYDDATTGIRADLSGAYSGTGDAAGDHFVSVENLVGSAFNDVLFGDAGANRLYGGAGADNLYGGAGDDALYGGAGDDNLQGGAGADLLDGGDGFDFAYYSLAAAGVTVDLADQSSNMGDAAGDQLVSIEGLVGSAFDDTLRGDARANILTGGAGNDILEGREGNDTLYGGAGDDEAWFAGARSTYEIIVAEGKVTVRDLAPGEDGDTGTDTLYDIETLRFKGGETVSLVAGAPGASLNQTLAAIVQDMGSFGAQPAGQVALATPPRTQPLDFFA
ncbi:calcium-binding protein [Sphingopyxis granuli]|uniref:calcium-binding protein n=1 Tax=Sphingopyxis granuli TaxID=267128 RepID=UPI001BAF9AAA|nr:hypothetical protein [Sphingopyxis granuli]QUM71321.1 hypothetical protein ICN83_13290 [Sphingopyxis granuli]